MEEMDTRRNQEFKIILQCLDDSEEEGNESPNEFIPIEQNYNSKSIKINREIIFEGNKSSSKTISSEKTIDDLLHKSRTEEIIDKLLVKQCFKLVELTPGDVKIYEYMAKTIKKCFDFTHNTIHIAFILFLKYSKAQESDPYYIATSALLIASKYQEPLYKVPFVEDLIEKFTKPNKDIVDKIKLLEVAILLELDWNLTFITIIQACYHILESKTDLSLCEKAIETDIAQKFTYAMPLFNNSKEVLINRENSIISLTLGQPTENSNVEIMKRRRVKKLHSNSCWNVGQDLQIGLVDQDSCFLKVPKMTRRKHRRRRKKHSRIAQISEGLSDILKRYEASDSENTRSDTSYTDLSSFDDSLSSVSDISISKNEPFLQSEVEISEKSILENSRKPTLQIISKNKV